MSAEPTISVGHLRQNPTEMLRHVKEGTEYLLTDHGAPIARIVPLTQGPWVSEQKMRGAFRTPVDPAWRRELGEQRAETDMPDPFDR
jgi:prevent-host-death family protein